MANNDLKQEQSQKSITIEDILKCRITDETPIKDLEPIISFEDSIFCATNEMSFISGKPKAGKTSVASVMLSICLTPNPTFDTLGMKGKYCEGKPIIYIDSEQSKRSSKKILERIRRNLGINKSPENFFLYNFRHLGYEALKRSFEILLEHHKGAFLWFLDGISDMVKSVNNEEEASFLISRFLNSKVEEEETAMILFLHENSTSSSDKMRGHLGSEAQRKCFATVSISKDKKTQTHSIKSVESREGRNFEEVLFRFDESTKSMVQLKGYEYDEAKKHLDDTDDLWDAASVIKDAHEKVRSKEMYERLSKYKGWGTTKAKEKIKEMVQIGILQKEEKSKNEVFYSLSTSDLLHLDTTETS
ncbi:MAG: hypothetical protein MUC49_14060 [Raineya sp.]|jgi:hypothetical protein|nr:hypothetical protein [Raineya sp.]